MSRPARDVLRTASAEAFLAAEPAAVYAAALDLAARLWQVDADAVVVDSLPDLLVHSVVLDGEVNCWLTWEFTAVDPGVTRVRLAHDDADPRPAPAPELDQVVTMLRTHLQPSEPV